MKLCLTILSLVIFSSSINLYNARLNKLENINTIDISLFLKSNKIYCTQKDGDIAFDVSICNRSIIPKIKRILCISLHDWSQHMVVLNIVHNEEKYMLNCCEDKCATPDSKILMKGFPVSIYKVVGFNNLVRQNDGDFLVRKNNTSFGIYSIQAAYILKNDTLYSNKIFVEYKKE